MPDIVTAPGPGGGPHIKLVNGTTGATVAPVAGAGGGDDPAGAFAQPIRARSSARAAEAAGRPGGSEDGEEKREKMSGC